VCHLVLLLPVLALPVFWLWPPSIAVPVYGLALAVSLTVYVLAMKTMRMPRLNGSDGIVGQTGRVVRVDERGLTLQIGGEYWAADAGGEIFEVDDRVLVTGIDRLRLAVGRPAQAREAPPSARPSPRPGDSRPGTRNGGRNVIERH